MRVLVVHNQYRNPGGEDRVVEQESALLRSRGHEVGRLTVTNRAISGFFSECRVAWRASRSPLGRDLCRTAIEQAKPQVVHVHNLFPLLTPSVLEPCGESRVPVVMTLHNYRLMCPSGLMMRNDSTCDDCIRGSPYRAALHRCYRSSIMGSLSAARTVAVHRRRGTWRTEVSQFIALTEFGRRLFVAGGLPASRLRVKPNFCSDPGQRQSSRQRVALFAGRLSTEKGIGTLLKAWESVDGRLRIAGEGSIGMEPKERVRGLGLLAAEDLGREMGRAQFLVMPSEWFEGFPMAIVEAFAHGLPVLCSRLGAMAEIVQDHRTGLYFEAGNHEDLARKANWLLRHPEECARMGGQARLEYESKYTPEKNYGMLMEIYGTAVEGARN